MADMFHVTRLRDVQDIIQQGLVGGEDSPALKNVKEEVAATAPEESRGPDPLGGVEEPPDERANRELEELLTDVQHSRDHDWEKFPNRDFSVFFWGTKAQAYDAAEEGNVGTAIVAVEHSRLPEECECAVGSHRKSSRIWNELWDLYRHRGGTPPRDLIDDAKEFWRGVHWYEGNAGRGEEIWCGCNIPPNAIEYIENGATGKILWHRDESFGGIAPPEPQEFLDRFSAPGGW